MLRLQKMSQRIWAPTWYFASTMSSALSGQTCPSTGTWLSRSIKHYGTGCWMEARVDEMHNIKAIFGCVSWLLLVGESQWNTSLVPGTSEILRMAGLGNALQGTAQLTCAWQSRYMYRYLYGITRTVRQAECSYGGLRGITGTLA
ncbi:hypothetical protein GGI35DRAFT_443811 [Trichoderma velutinum]